MTNVDRGALADAVAAEALAVPAVIEMHGGAFGEVATYLPGRAVTGVRLGAVTEVHVVAENGTPLHAVADDVRRAVTVLVDGPVDVYIEDVR